ncbi:MAG: hypothetical protein EU544_06475 [Promethearchaeota archaeon]|nr:MAG: hypothetical protein EU544_06475 [Candidatus Lokiarchaeota archaeon]
MSAGKSLCIIGGIITLIAVYLTSWIASYGLLKVYGMGGIFSLGDLFLYAESEAIDLNIPVWSVYIVGIGVVLTLGSGVLILLGTKSRAPAIIGAIFPLFIGIMLLLFTLNIYIFDYLYIILAVFTTIEPLIPGVDMIPIIYDIANISLGLILLLAGSLLGLIGGIVGPE